MRMSDHLLQGVVISLVFVLGLWFLIVNDSVLFNSTIVGIIGFLVGIVYPDTDCKDSTIFRIHPKREEIKNKFNRAVSFIVYPLAYALKFFVYSVEYFVVSRINNRMTKDSKRFKWTHRNLTHSIFGVLVGGIVVFLWGLLVSLKVSVTLQDVLVFSSLFSAGAFFHLIQDSFGESKYVGIKLFYPFSNKGLKGNLKWMHGSGDNRNTILSFVLVGLLLVTFFIRGEVYEVVSRFISRRDVIFWGVLSFYLVVIA
ncbi:MAG: metal-dependent hydrolase, partial [Nanoarchaeota archaeon]